MTLHNGCQHNDTISLTVFTITILSLTAFRITILSIIRLSTMTLSIMTLSTMTLSIMTQRIKMLSITVKNVTLSINDTQHNDSISFTMFSIATLSLTIDTELNGIQHNNKTLHLE